MGLYFSGYVGPYIQCTVRVSRAEVDVTGCTRPRCPQYAHRVRFGSDTGFCSACGSPRGVSKMMVELRPDFHELVGEVLAQVEPNKTTDPLILIPNVHVAHVARHLNRHDQISLDLESVDPKAEIEVLKEAFKREIATLERSYDAVTIKWGLHIWYS